MIIWSPGVSLDQVEKQIIIKAFEHFRKNKSATAMSLGITVRTLENKFERYAEEEKDELARTTVRRQRQANFVARSRGLPVPHPELQSAVAEQSMPETDSGEHLESAEEDSTESTLPVSESKEVQALLSKSNTRHSKRDKRRELQRANGQR